MIGSSRVSNYLIWGALIGALFLWSASSIVAGVSPNLHWVIRDFDLFLIFCFVSPVLEEYVFRGLIYDYVERRNQRAWPVGGVLQISVANLVSTLLFAMMHGVFRGVSSGLLVIVPSLYLGLLRRETYGLGPCMIVHGLWNLGWFSLFPPGSGFG
ncbi:MAG: JDVT-CTERM system glutamic-type intramembrane protease MrtJ [Pseudomonadales bacterium]